MSFRIALSGLNAASTHLDVTANNIANVETSGFKESRAEFANVFAAATTGVSASQVGAGVRVASVSQQFSQGNINFTNNNLDLAISGQGFFTLAGSQGLVYSRDGAFSVDENGFVVNSNLQRLQVFPATTAGNFATGSLTDLQLVTTASAPSATTEATVGLNLPADAAAPAVAFDPAVPASFNHSTSLTVYDSLGTAHTATMYFVKDAAPNTWNQFLYIDGTAAPETTPTQLVYSSGGVLQAPASGQVTYDSFPLTNGAANLDLTFNYTDTTQFGSTFGVDNLSQNGFESGRLTGIEISKLGVVSARFSNRQTVELGKVALTAFNNPQGLQQLGDNTWAETAASGEPRLNEPGSSNLGLVQSGALEASNVDLTAQLVEMITAQRNFQANTQMISTSDQVTQAIINIR